MLLQGEELSPDQEEYVEKILFKTQRLSGLVGNILLLSKLENQNIPMKKTEYRLDEQIRQAFLSLETKWTEKEIGFQADRLSFLEPFCALLCEDNLKGCKNQLQIL